MRNYGIGGSGMTWSVKFAQTARETTASLHRS